MRVRAVLYGLREAPRRRWAAENSLLAILCVYDSRRLYGRVTTVADEAILTVASACRKKYPSKLGVLKYPRWEDARASNARCR